MHSGQAIGMLAGVMQTNSKDANNGTGSDASRDEGSANGLQLIAAQGPVSLQAQQDELKIQARDLVNVRSAHGHIDWAAAKKITLSTAGGANITIENGNITVQCSGKITVHAGQKEFLGPARLNYPMRQLPKSVCLECLKKVLQLVRPLRRQAERKVPMLIQTHQLTGWTRSQSNCRSCWFAFRECKPMPCSIALSQTLATRL
jgi:type VI secretion system secreted protein VgrG